MTDPLSADESPRDASARQPLAASPEPRFRLRSFLWYWAPIIVYGLLIYVGSSMSSLPDVAGRFPDKLEHFCEYAVLGILLARALAGRRWLSITFPYVAAAVLLAALYGISDEYHQLFVPGRDFDPRDMLADALGASASTGALWAWGIIRRNS